MHSALTAALLMMLSTLVVGPPQKTEPENGSRIEGIVVRTMDSAPLAGVVLLLKKDGGGLSEKQYGTVTASDGHFIFRDIPSGRYTLAASKKGFIDRPGGVLDLTSSQVLRNLTIRMVAGGVISGRVSDQTGQAIEGAMIRVFARKFQRDGQPLLSEVAATLTNDLGEYRHYWLAPGTYYLHAIVLPNKTSFAETLARIATAPSVIDQSQEPPDAFLSLFYPGGNDDSQATPIRIEAGAELHSIDFSVTRSKAVRVKGRVVSEAGGPVTDAALDLVPKYVTGGFRSGLSAYG